MSLLNELKKLKPQLPETECFVPEWNRAITLRGFTVREGRQLRLSADKDGGDQANEALAIKTIAHAIADGDERPLANADGVSLIESLSELTVRKLMTTFALISNPDTEGNAGAPNGASSTDSPLPSDAQRLN